MAPYFKANMSGTANGTIQVNETMQPSPITTCLPSETDVRHLVTLRDVLDVDGPKYLSLNETKVDVKTNRSRLCLEGETVRDWSGELEQRDGV